MQAASLILALTISIPCQTIPTYRYFPVPRVTPGSTLYACPIKGDLPVCADLFAFRDMQKAIHATDKAGIAELRSQDRLFMVAPGTAVKILQYEADSFTEIPAYEVRVMDGSREGRKGWVVAPWLGGREVVTAKGKGRAKASRASAGGSSPVPAFPH